MPSCIAPPPHELLWPGVEKGYARGLGVGGFYERERGRGKSTTYKRHSIIFFFFFFYNLLRDEVAEKNLGAEAMSLRSTRVLLKTYSGRQRNLYI